MDSVEALTTDLLSRIAWMKRHYAGGPHAASCTVDAQMESTRIHLEVLRKAVSDLSYFMRTAHAIRDEWDNRSPEKRSIIFEGLFDSIGRPIEKANEREKCEHGVYDYEYCKPCSDEYKRAAKEAGLDEN